MVRQLLRATFALIVLLGTGQWLHAQQAPDCGNCDCLFASITTATSGAPNLATAGGGCPGTGTFVVNANTFRRITAPIGNRYTLSVCGSTTTNTVMFVTNNTATGTVRYGCDDDGCGAPNGPSLVQWVSVNNAASGHRVWIFDGDCGTPLNETVTVTFTCEPPPPTPPNDEPCGAIPLPLNSGCVYTNTNSTGATLTSSVTAPTGCLDSGGGPAAPLLQNDVWYSTTVPASGLLGISTEGASLCAGAFALYTAPSCSGTFTQLANACSLLGTTGPTSEPAGVFDVSSLPVGSTIYIRFWERNGDENGTFQICAYEAERPVNDEPCGAITLPVTVGCTFTTYTNAVASPLSTVTANPNPVTAGCGGPATNDLWFAVTVTADMVTNGFTVNTQGGTVTNMAMAWYRLTGGSACGPGTMTQIACNDNQSGSNLMPRINSDPGVTLVLGETIYIRVWAQTPWEGTFGICATVNQPPPNNTPCGALPLAVNFGCSMSTFSNENATNTPQPFAGGSFTSGNNQPTCQAGWNGDVWFTVVMPPNGNIQLDTQVGSMINGGMALYTASGSCATNNLSLTQVACANAGSQQGPASVNMPYINYTNAGLAGQTLYVRVWRQGAANPNGNFSLCARRTDAPPGDCFYTLNLFDSAGDGWNGSFVTVCVGAVCNNYTVNGSTASVNIGANIGQLITVSYTSVGGFQNQNSFNLTQFGAPVYISGATPPTGLVFAETVDCQPPPAPQSDCLGAFTLCNQNLLVNQAPSNTGGVQDLNLSNRGCFNNNERQGLWYVWTVQESGNLAFTIFPQPWPVPAGTPFTIFDWAIWGPYAGLTCPPPGPPIRCNWASVFAPKGMQFNNSLPTSVGGAGPPMIRHLPVLAGEVYTLYVDNWGMTGLNFSIEWGTTTDPAFQPMASVDCIILPVDLIGFDAFAKAHEVEVTWRTVSDHNSAFFDVERSADGIHFSTIGRVAAEPGGVNTLDYTFIDPAPLEGVSYYRLRRVDGSNREDRTDAKQVVFRRGVATMELFPNPTNNDIQVLYELPQEGVVFWTIRDASGRRVMEGNNAGDRGRNRMELPVARLEQGTYILELRDGQGNQQGVGRFVKH